VQPAKVGMCPLCTSDPRCDAMRTDAGYSKSWRVVSGVEQGQQNLRHP
jgi:hypothetical protein